MIDRLYEKEKRENFNEARDQLIRDRTIEFIDEIQAILNNGPTNYPYRRGEVIAIVLELMQEDRRERT